MLPQFFCLFIHSSLPGDLENFTLSLNLTILLGMTQSWSFLSGWLSGKESACVVGDPSLIPGSRRFPGGGHGNPLQCSCLEDPMDRGAWWTTVHRVTKSQTQLKQLRTHACMSQNWSSRVHFLRYPASPFYVFSSFCVSGKLSFLYF